MVKCISNIHRLFNCFCPLWRHLWKADSFHGRPHSLHDIIISLRYSPDHGAAVSEVWPLIFLSNRSQDRLPCIPRHRRSRLIHLDPERSNRDSRQGENYSLNHDTHGLWRLIWRRACDWRGYRRHHDLAMGLLVEVSTRLCTCSRSS